MSLVNLLLGARVIGSLGIGLYSVVKVCKLKCEHSVLQHHDSVCVLAGSFGEPA